MFVTFEGIEGAGKSSVIQLVAEELRKSGQDVFLTREPGASSLGQSLRALLLEKQTYALAPAAELYLFLADRAQHVQEALLPALKRGAIALCDRYIDSTIAYQGAGRGIDPDFLRQSCFSDPFPQPDRTFLLDAPVETGLRRVAARTKLASAQAKEGRIDNEAPDFHRRVREAYLELAHLEPERIMVLDATRPLAEVAQACIRRIEQDLKI